MNEIERPYNKVADIFPLMQGSEYEELKRDIAANGLLEPIWIHPDGSIIDGRNRHRACIETNTPPRFNTWQGTGSLVAFVVSLNLHRRHLTSSQRAAVAQDILPMLEAEARERQAHGLTAPGQTLSQTFDQASNGKASEHAAEILGTNRQYVSDAKRLKTEAPDLFQQVKAGEITIPQAKKQIRRKERVQSLAEINAGNEPFSANGNRYVVIYADPPWKYEHTKTDNRRIENHYPTMTLEEIKRLPVIDIAHDDCILFLWATSPKLEEAMQVIDSWGFTYRTCMIWDKEIIGMGYYARQQHELLLIAARGSVPVPEPEARPASVHRERRSKHSSKPGWFRTMIANMYPDYSRIELFARSAPDGWTVWGNQS